MLNLTDAELKEMFKNSDMLKNGWSCGWCDTDNPAGREKCMGCDSHFTTSSNLVYDHDLGEYVDLNFH